MGPWNLSACSWGSALRRGWSPGSNAGGCHGNVSASPSGRGKVGETWRKAKGINTGGNYPGGLLYAGTTGPRGASSLVQY